ncbi:MAG: hypothetical protein Q4G70_14500 [Pseudomonadota bacterium]|nr:hypothetical protein [Pseudomonadota bacterium]
MTEDQKRPLAVFYAGTNGSGKSTLRDSNPFPGLKVIDPDAIARGINPENPRSVDMEAGRVAARQFQDAIAQGHGFSMETTLTGRTVLNRLEKAKNAGFDVRLYYVGLDAVERNVDRVAARVAQGGHHIDEHDIRRRYGESLENLPKAMQIADSGKIFSNDRIKHVVQYEFGNGILERKVPEPAQWAQEAVKAQTRHVETTLEPPVLTPAQSLKEIDRIANDLKAKPLPGGLAAVVERADPQARRPYNGKIVAATEHHALQQVGANKFIVHERDKSASQVLTVGKNATITYGQAAALQPDRDKSKGKGFQR